MNARQVKKQLKKKISKLESDNNLMRRIIEDSPEIQELYNVYTKPLKVTHTTMQFQEYRSKRFLPPNRLYDARFIELYKQELAKDLFENIKENITYELDMESPIITASIFVGKLRG